MKKIFTDNAFFFLNAALIAGLIAVGSWVQSQSGTAPVTSPITATATGTTQTSGSVVQNPQSPQSSSAGPSTGTSGVSPSSAPAANADLKNKIKAQTAHAGRCSAWAWRFRSRLPRLSSLAH